jgi:hypothetical protein
MEIPTQIANKARLPVGTGSSHGVSNHLTLRPVFTWQRIDNKYNQIGKAKEAQAFDRVTTATDCSHLFAMNQ